jgi:hypothetical protein
MTGRVAGGDKPGGVGRWTARGPRDLAEAEAPLDHPTELPEGGLVSKHALSLNSTCQHPAPSRPPLAQTVALLIAAQLRREAEEAATTSRDFGRGMSHAAAVVQRIAMQGLGA